MVVRERIEITAFEEHILFGFVTPNIIDEIPTRVI